MDQRPVTGRPPLRRLFDRFLTSAMLKDGHVYTRPELARETGLSRARIATLAAELLAAGLVEEVGLGESTGGRPPMRLKFVPGAATALGAVLQDQTWSIVVTDLGARVLHEQQTDVDGQSPEAAVAALKLGVDAVIPVIETLGKPMLPAIGLGTPGLVDVRSGIIKSAVDVGWFEVPFQRMVEDALGVQAFIANRSKLGALAELWHSAEHGINDLIYLSIGTGVAAGIVHQGRLYLGSNSSAGEVGHLTVVPDGPPCPCGNRGCLQQLVSQPVIVKRARDRLRSVQAGSLYGLVDEELTVDAIFAAAAAGDAVAREVVDETAAYLGIAVANLVNLFNPELIVLGGPVGESGQVLLDPLRAEVRKRAMAYPASIAEIKLGAVGPNASAVGAAVLTLERAMELLLPIILDHPNDLEAV